MVELVEAVEVVVGAVIWVVVGGSLDESDDPDQGLRGLSPGSGDGAAPELPPDCGAGFKFDELDPESDSD